MPRCISLEHLAVGRVTSQWLSSLLHWEIFMNDFLIDQILPSREVHIIAGPSGAGKTTWILQTLVLDWQHGREVLGFKSFPVPWLYVSSDRSRKSVAATLKRMSIPESALRFVSAVDAGCHNIEKVIELAEKLSPRPEFLYIDGILNLLPDKVHPNDNKSVSKWLSDQTRRCDTDNRTLMGSLHSPKMKSDEWYDNPRQRISGGASWAGFADTVILVEPVSPDDESQSHHRRLLVLPRNAKQIVKNLAFNDQGRLVESDEVLNDDLIYAFIIGIKPGDTFRMERVLTIFDGTMSRPTIYKMLEKYIQSGAIERVSQGVYKRVSGVQAEQV
jgi:AAA domain-containing protein